VHKRVLNRQGSGFLGLKVSKSGDTLIKQFLRQQDNHVELQQFGPEATTQLPVADITAITRIVGQWERG